MVRWNRDVCFHPDWSSWLHSPPCWSGHSSLQIFYLGQLLPSMFSFVRYEPNMHYIPFNISIKKLLKCCSYWWWHSWVTCFLKCVFLLMSYLVFYMRFPKWKIVKKNNKFKGTMLIWDKFVMQKFRDNTLKCQQLLSYC